MKLKLSTLLWITFGLGAVATIVAMPRIRARRRADQERAALVAIKSIANAQTLYREGDKDGNGVPDYAPDLASLVRCGLLEPELAEEEHRGYRFAVRHHAGQGADAARDQFLWSATAEPVYPGDSGQRYYGTNMTGLVFFSRQGPVVFSEDRADSTDNYFCDCSPNGL